MLDNVNKFTISEIVEEIKNASSDSLVYVGTDSKQTKLYTTFITVIIIHYGVKSGHGKGCRVFPFIHSVKKIKELKPRLLEEVNISVSYALDIAYDVEGNIRIPTENIEVHMDINTNPRHKSSVAVKEALAYVQGQHMIPRFKPDALASTGASDWILRRPNLKLKVA